MFYRKLLVILPCFFFTSLGNVSENTGAMNFTQPLFSVSGNKINFPVSLSYMAGIKINQHASWVGLGFDLSLPYIERTPQGSVDEKAGAFNCYSEGFYSQKTYDRLVTPAGNGYNSSPAPGNFTNQQDSYFLSAPFGGGRIVLGQPSGANPNGTPLKAYLQNWRPLRYTTESMLPPMIYINGK